MKKIIQSILVAVAVFFVIVVIQTLVRNMTFTEALSRPYYYFLAAIAFIGTFTQQNHHIAYFMSLMGAQGNKVKPENFFAPK